MDAQGVGGFRTTPPPPSEEKNELCAWRKENKFEMGEIGLSHCYGNNSH